MKKLFSISFLVVSAGALSVGCSANASVHKADATRVSTTAQVAYVTAPAR